MNAHALHYTPQLPAAETARLYGLGFSLLPLGGGADGKSPLVKFSTKERLPLKRILAPMHRTGSACYGVRLDGLAVVDCDDDDDGLVRQMEARFGPSPVHVTTPRGRHLYYRAGNGAFPNLRKEGLPVDIKQGASSYVVGPGSVRPDGGGYASTKGMLGVDPLPPIRLPQPQRRVGAKVETGSRNYAITLSAIEMVEAVDDADELFENLIGVRDDECVDPDSIPNDELRKIAEWAWSKRLEGKVFRGRDSDFRLHRVALDSLKGLPNFSDALALLVVLQDQHGHVVGRTFPLDHSAMTAAGLTDLTRRRFLDARRSLEEANLLEVAKRHQAAHCRRTYRLRRLRPAVITATNVTEMRPSRGGGV